MDGPTVTFAPCDPALPPASELLTEMAAELNALYGTSMRLQRPALQPADLRPPHGTYLVGSVDGVAVAGGGLRALGEGTAEVKRMFVRPSARSRGVAGALLKALEAAAADLGYARVRLDTGPKQEHALALYRRAGYQPVTPYNDNPFASFWGEKQLPGVPAPGGTVLPQRR
jgi:GNAT superfamily N-acetyltransferase